MIKILNTAQSHKVKRNQLEQEIKCTCSRDIEQAHTNPNEIPAMHNTVRLV